MFWHHHSLTVAAAVDTYLADLAVAGRSKGTLGLYRYLLRGLVVSLSNHELTSIRREDVLSFLGHVKERGGCQNYTNLTARTVRGFLGWCVRQGYIEHNPMDGMLLPKEHWQPRRPFSADEVRRLIVAATAPLARAVLLLLLDTGMRASELAGLRLTDVDLETNTLTIHGKGSKVRFIALNDRPREALMAWLASRPQENGIIWPERFDRNALAYILDGVGQRAHVAPVFPHRFRHTFATNFLRETNNPLALQAILGHSSLDMVRRYIAASQQDLALDVHRQHPLVA
jgi:site-specific recombinase XerD